MYYRIRHLTRYQYSAPVAEALMELRMQPRTESFQRCLDFDLNVTPRTRVHSSRDFLGNVVHYFSIPGSHRQLQITAECIVETQPLPDLPASLPESAWEELDRIIDQGDFWENLLPSHFSRPTLLLEQLMVELQIHRRDDPLSLVRELNQRLYHTFAYEPHNTHVDSPIDDCLRLRKGVCQDFAHVMIAMLRQLRIPARYVSGYLHHRKQDHDRSSDGATHAWLECFLPQLGWVGFDPTNNLIAGERHIRTAIGRDYADVPPTRGVYKGEATTRLTVGVGVSACADLPPEIAEMVMERDNAIAEEVIAAEAAFALDDEYQQQQQQQ